LGATPKFIIVKDRDDAYHWITYHANMNSSPASGKLYLSTTDSFGSDSTTWNNTIPTSSVFSVGSMLNTNQSGRKFIAYLWSEVP
jgi:hypothetical protein